MLPRYLAKQINNKATAIIVIVTLIVVLLVVICAPLLLIWCINVLLGISTAITFKSWFAALLISILISFRLY